MKIATPLQTAWPAGVIAVLLLLALWRSRDELRLPKGWGWALLVLLAVRIVWIPGITGHIYDGHEADYYDLFRGVRLPTRGGTVLYPAMQWLWYGMGAIGSIPSATAATRSTAAPLIKEGSGTIADDRTTTLAGSWLRAAALHTKILRSRDS